MYILLSIYLKFSESLLSCVEMKIYASNKRLWSIDYVLDPVSSSVNIMQNKIKTSSPCLYIIQDKN